MPGEAARRRVFGVAGRPVVIAGPCSAESEAQVVQTAVALAQAGVHVFRAGVWKPRSRPDTFQGHGVEALSWLAAARQASGLPVATEVGNARHVAAALQAGVDVLWVGARTTVNTFAVDEIAEALAGVDVPVLVKNPVSPDLELWTGALERLLRAGVRRVAAVHRGFTRALPGRYRNDPRWHIPIDLAGRLPDVPLLADPSHLAGRRALVGEAAQTAMDLGYDGLMVEAHADPDAAWSDKEQQITPAAVAELLARLVLRTPDAPGEAWRQRLAALRGQIDDVDAELLELLARRMRASEEIGRLKRLTGVEILQAGRWSAVLARVLHHGAALGLHEDFLRRVFNAIHEESIAHQTGVGADGAPAPERR